MKEIANKLSFLEPELVSEILNVSSTQYFSKGTEILREDQYVKVLPIVIHGLVKVFSRFEERELLLYYIKQNESCIMSFTASINDVPSKVFAITEEDSEILLVPVNKLSTWLNRFPKLNTLFYQQYNLRYTELLTTIKHVLIDKMDERLHQYLKEKSKAINQSTVQISHQQIANDMGTAREVISRVMKKLESEGKVIQLSQRIQILMP